MGNQLLIVYIDVTLVQLAQQMSTALNSCYTVYTGEGDESNTTQTLRQLAVTSWLSRSDPVHYIRSLLIQLFMSVKLMIELLKRGKTGNEMLKILDAVTSSESKLTAETNAIVLDKPQVQGYALSEPAMFWSLVYPTQSI